MPIVSEKSNFWRLIRSQPSVPALKIAKTIKNLEGTECDFCISYCFFVAKFSVLLREFERTFIANNVILNFTVDLKNNKNN